MDRLKRRYVPLLRRTLNAEMQFKLSTFEGGFTVEDGEPDPRPLPDSRWQNLKSEDILEALTEQRRRRKELGFYIIDDLPLKENDRKLIEQIELLIQTDKASSEFIKRASLDPSDPRWVDENAHLVSSRNLSEVNRLKNQLSNEAKTNPDVLNFLEQAKRCALGDSYFAFLDQLLMRVESAEDRLFSLNEMEKPTNVPAGVYLHFEAVMQCYLLGLNLPVIICARATLESALKHLFPKSRDSVEDLIDTACNNDSSLEPFRVRAKDIYRLGNDAAHKPTALRLKDQINSKKDMESFLTDLRGILNSLYGASNHQG